MTPRERVKAALAGLEQQLPPGSHVAVVMDGAKFIRSSIASVQEDMILGGILAVVVVLVFLRNVRSTLVSAVALPTAIVGTFAVMKALGFTFNIITMLALTLSIGLLIDDAIVVIENIVRHLEHGESPKVAAEKGTSEHREREKREEKPAHDASPRCREHRGQRASAGHQ